MSARLALLAWLALVPAAHAQDTFDAAVRPDSGIGEPTIHVNPKDPTNLVVGENDTGASVSFDRGATWRPVAMINPGDNVLAVGPDGTFTYSALDGDVRSSSDRGATWTSVGNWVGVVAAQAHTQSQSGPGAVAGRELGCSAPAPLGPGSTDPAQGPGVHVIGCDRPWLFADPSTGALHVSFTSHNETSGGEGAPGWETGLAACKATVLTNPAFECGRQYVSTSRDRGRTWSRFVPFDSADHPAGVTGGFSAGPVASGGILATSYLAGDVPGAAECPCVVFQTSTDDGVTWKRHVIPGATATPTTGTIPLEPSLLFEPYTAADPSTPGRYAVMIFDATQTRLIVYVTTDSGATWHEPARLGEEGGAKRYLPWIAYGPTGALGVMWRTGYTDGSYAAWAAVAPQGDARFARPVRLSSETSPGPIGQLAGDDNSDVDLDAQFLHAAWGDRRTGSLGTRYGRYRFAADLAVQAVAPPALRHCISRRRFAIRLRAPRGQRLRSARVYVNGRRVRVLRGRRLRSVVDLRGLPRGTVRVRVVARTTTGRRVVDVRAYRTCVPRA